MSSLFKTANKHLHYFCETISERHLGSQGNKQATGYFTNVLKQNRWKSEESPLEVMDWKTDGVSRHCGKQSFEVFSSPYSLGCNVEGELTAIDSISKLQHANLPLPFHPNGSFKTWKPRTSLIQKETTSASLTTTR